MSEGSVTTGATAAPTTTPTAPSSPQTSSSTHSAASQGGQNTSQQTPNAPPSTPQAREYKINGKMVKMSQQEADDYVSMSYVAQERFNEASRLRKEMEARESNYQKDPLKAFLDYAERAKLTPDQTRDALEKYYAKQYIDPEVLSKEEIALRSREERMQKWEQEQEELKVKSQQDEEIKGIESQKEFFINEIISALEASNLPKGNKFLVQRMAFYLHQNSMNGFDAPKETVLRQVVNEHKGIVGGFLKDASMEQVLNYAGQEFIDKVLKFSLDKLREGRNKMQEPFSANQSDAPYNPNEKIDYSEVNRRLRDMRSGKFVGGS